MEEAPNLPSHAPYEESASALAASYGWHYRRTKGGGHCASERIGCPNYGSEPQRDMWHLQRLNTKLTTR